MLCCEVLGNLGDHGFAAGLGDFDVDHVDLLVFDEASGLQQTLVDRNRAHVVELGLRDVCAVNLAL